MHGKHRTTKPEPDMHASCPLHIAAKLGLAHQCRLPVGSTTARRQRSGANHELLAAISTLDPPAGKRRAAPHPRHMHGPCRCTTRLPVASARAEDGEASPQARRMDHADRSARNARTRTVRRGGAARALAGWDLGSGGNNGCLPGDRRWWWPHLMLLARHAPVSACPALPCRALRT
jgi:hypothetical protein